MAVKDFIYIFLGSMLQVVYPRQVLHNHINLRELNKVNFYFLPTFGMRLKPKKLLQSQMAMHPEENHKLTPTHTQN